jgi:hypothetical protein
LESGELCTGALRTAFAWAGIPLVFLWFSFTCIFFRAGSMEKVGQVLPGAPASCPSSINWFRFRDRDRWSFDQPPKIAM